MEPLTTAAVAIGSVVATKALEKTGENVGEALWDKTSQFLSSLKKQSPNTVVAIEKAPQEPLDYNSVILEVEAAAKENRHIAQMMELLVTTVQAQHLPNLEPILQEITQALKSQPAIRENYNIEKIANFAKGNINIKNQSITL